MVLVGGGHAHVQVLRSWMMRPPADARLTVVLDRAEAVYSGMVPGFVAGDYEAHELEIDVVPLARRARARVVLAAATRIDPEQRRVELEGRPALRYDLASLDVGSSLRGLSLPGVREHALPTRPIRGLVDRLQGALERASAARAPLRIAVVGGGAAGLELAFTLRARLAASGATAELCVLTDGAALLPGHPARMVRRVLGEAERQGIRVRTGLRVDSVDKTGAFVAGGEHVPADLVVWATGAAPTALIGASPLPRDAAGFARVRSTLQVVGSDELFAAGDCAALEEFPWVPRAGVYAVREGPFLDRNLRACLRGRRLRRYRPQRDFLALLNLGRGRALGAKWGVVAAGTLMWRLKDWIDRRFMRRFQVPTGVEPPNRWFPAPEDMGMEEMECGGCAAKVASGALDRALARLPEPAADPSVQLGLSARDDAALLALPAGDRVLASVDGFRAFSDDAWLVGRVAAINAASDVQAKGGRARHALAIVTVPDLGEPATEEMLFQVMMGMRSALDPLGVSLVGGHSTLGAELFVGLTITGSLPEGAEPLALDAGPPGSLLVLTKPLGTGVVLAGDMQGRARGAWLAAATATMQQSNEAAARLARAHGALGCTDVSGFGLARHLCELLARGGHGAELWLDELPVLPGAAELLAAGVRSSFHDQNVGTVGLAPQVDPGVAHELVFDPQTAGGLLIALPPERAGDLVSALRPSAPTSAVVGRVVPRAAGAPAILLARRRLAP